MAAGWLLALDSRSRTLAQRTRNVSRPYAPAVTSSAARSLRLRGSATNTGLAERLSRLIGLEMNRPDLYPVPWWVVLVLMVGVGFAAARLVLFLVGDIGW